MVKLCGLVVILGLARVAAAAPEAEVQAAVKDTIDHLGDSKSAAHMAKGAMVVGQHGNVIDFTSGKILDGEHGDERPDFATNGRLWPMIFGGKEKPAESRRTLGTITVVVDGEQAWFAAPLALTGAGKPRAMHVSGQAVHGAAGWTLQWLQVGWAIPDADLRKFPALVPAIAMKAAKPDSELGKAVISWLTTKSFAKHAAPGVVLAGGSAPAELASGPDAIKLAASWDKLKLVPPSVRTDGSNVATVTVWLPLGAEQDGAAEFVLVIYAVKADSEWKWRSLQFVDDQVPGWE